jgi:hypothetical protein
MGFTYASQATDHFRANPSLETTATQRIHQLGYNTANVEHRDACRAELFEYWLPKREKDHPYNSKS